MTDTLSNYKSGDLVRLRSGGTIMTVHISTSYTPGSYITCYYWDQAKNQVAWAELPPAVLEAATIMPQQSTESRSSDDQSF